jgi:endonuclease YncB( thermonuclease family)
MTARALTLAGLLLTGLSPAIGADLVGPVVHIRDGDTFVMRAGDRLQPIRLCGVDTPERGQPGYASASAALQAMIGGRTVTCLRVGAGTPCDRRSAARSHDRVVAQCFIDGADVAEHLVRTGHACAWPRFSSNYYRLTPETCIKGD